jgi:hypothetical protein
VVNLTILRSISIPAYGVFILGFVMRLIAWGNTWIINPDGALFIHQARAIYYGQTDTLFCALDYLANLPVLIAGSYWIFHDWVFAARFVSFVFGFATLIPIYFLLKRSFDEQTSALGTLILAVMPVFVGSSVDIVRDPISWFFVTVGLYCFTVGLEGKTSSPLTLSCLCFMMAAWARIEASLLIVFSFLYLAATRQERRSKKILSFLLPVLGLSLLILILVLMAGDHSSIIVRMKTALLGKFTSPLAQYYSIQGRLSELALDNRYDSFGFFIAEVKKDVWLIALGSLLNRLLEAFFYPFFLVCVVGIVSSLRRSHSDSKVRYATFVSLMLLITLYLHMFRAWYIDYRHMCILILTCTVFLGSGVTSIWKFLQIRTHVNKTSVSFIIALCICVLPLYKNILARDADKRVFQDIGEFIYNLEPGNDVISIAASCSYFRVISFYANLNYQGAPCPEGTEKNCWEYFTNSFDEFHQHLKKENIKYFVWSERQWSTQRMDIFMPPYNVHFKELSRWSHPDTGQMILFEVT